MQRSHSEMGGENGIGRERTNGDNFVFSMASDRKDGQQFGVIDQRRVRYLFYENYIRSVYARVTIDRAISLKNVCRKLSLSTNMIEKISGINTLKYLRILSLSRNNIKTFSGLEAIGDHLEELWISYNSIEKIKGVNALTALKVLYMGNNLVKDWAEFNRLQEIPNLQDLLFINNPICENMDAESWRAQVIRRLPTLKKLDAIPIVYVIIL